MGDVSPQSMCANPVWSDVVSGLDSQGRPGLQCSLLSERRCGSSRKAGGVDAAAIPSPQCSPSERGSKKGDLEGERKLLAQHLL